MDNYALVSTFSDLDENKYLKDFCDYQSISIDQFFEFNDYSNMIKKKEPIGLNVTNPLAQ